MQILATYIPKQRYWQIHTAYNNKILTIKSLRPASGARADTQLCLVLKSVV